MTQLPVLREGPASQLIAIEANRRPHGEMGGISVLVPATEVACPRGMVQGTFGGRTVRTSATNWRYLDRVIFRGPSREPGGVLLAVVDHDPLGRFLSVRASEPLRLFGVFQDHLDLV